MAKVLLVEDDNNLREIYEARLQAEGYEIKSAADGEAALVIAKDFKPELIISDVMMPKISGFEMLDILHNTPGLEHTHVIMLTALGQAEDKSRADALGADRYLVKSQVTLEDIVRSAHDVLDDGTADEPAAADTENSEATASVEATAPVENSQPDLTVASEPEVTSVAQPEVVAETSVEAAPENLDSAPEVQYQPESVSSDPITPDTTASDATSETNDLAEPVADDTLTGAVIDQPESSDDSEAETTEHPNPEAVVETPEPAANTDTSEASAAAATQPGTAQDDQTTAPSEPVTSAPAMGGAPEVPVSASQPASDVHAPTPDVPLNSEQATPDPKVEPAGQPERGSIASEEAVIEKQIEDFIASSDQPAAANETNDASESVETPETAEASAPTSDEVPSTPVPDISTPADANDELLNDAVDSLAGKPAVDAQPSGVITPTQSAPEPEAVPPKPVLSQPNDDSVTVGKKKVISPIPSESKPSLDELLAREEAKEAVASAGATVPSPAEQTSPPLASRADPGAETQPSTPPQPAPDEFDPNSIAL